MGATTAVFTVVDTVVFRPLAYHHPKRLVRLYTEFPTFPNGGLRRFAVSPPAFLEMREMLRKFKGPGLRGLAARAPYFHNGSDRRSRTWSPSPMRGFTSVSPRRRGLI